MGHSVVTDRQLLDALLAHSDLPERLRGPFGEMAKRLGRAIGSLTQNQREWAQSEATKLGIDCAPVPEYRKQRRASPWDPGSSRNFNRDSRIR